MPFLTIREIFDIALMTIAIGYIFSDIFRRKPSEEYDPLAYYQKNEKWESIKNAAMIAAPALVLHELAHKFTAILFGAHATLHAPYFWYGMVILLKMLNFPFIFFVGGYVAHTPLPPLESALVSISGPIANLLIWAAALAAVKFSLVPRKYYNIIIPLGRISLFLGIFNLIPLPGFDGSNFIRSLIEAFS